MWDKGILGIWKPNIGSIPNDLRAGKEQAESRSSQGLSKLGEFFSKCAVVGKC